MTCQPSRPLDVRAGSSARSLAEERPFAARPRFALLRRLLFSPRLPRLDPADLTDHRLRDLGFRDGRAARPREKRRE